MENTTRDWKKLAFDIENTVNGAWEEFRSLPEENILTRPEPGEWSVKEILGHLIDSATNNHHRFVHLQINNQLDFPDYSKDNLAWVSVQMYQEAPWQELLDFFRQYNIHLARIIRNVDEKCVDHMWVLDENTKFKLGELMIDYLRHLNDHLGQIRKQAYEIP